MKARGEAREARRAALLVALRQGLSIAMAVASIGAGRDTVYKWRRTDAAFARAWADAVEEGTGLIEAEGLRRGMPHRMGPPAPKRRPALLEPPAPPDLAERMAAARKRVWG